MRIEKYETKFNEFSDFIFGTIMYYLHHMPELRHRLQVTIQLLLVVRILHWIYKRRKKWNERLKKIILSIKKCLNVIWNELVSGLITSSFFQLLWPFLFFYNFFSFNLISIFIEIIIITVLMSALNGQYYMVNFVSSYQIPLPCLFHAICRNCIN